MPDVRTNITVRAIATRSSAFSDRSVQTGWFTLLAATACFVLTSPLASATDDESVERSPSGAPIYRHEDPGPGIEKPEEHARNLEDIEAHVEAFIGPIETVYHENVSDRVHIDVIFVRATEDRPYNVLVTSGVGDLPMNVPEGFENLDRAELVIALPQSWPLTDEAFKDPSNYWPIWWLKSVGRLPHEYDTWLGWGHTIPNGSPWVPIADTRFIGVMLSLPYWLDPAFSRLQAASGDTINFYDVVPLYSEEMKLKLNQGVEELEARFDTLGIGYVVDVERPNAGLSRGESGR